MTLGDENATYGNDTALTADIINDSGVYGALTIGVTFSEGKIGASPLENRKYVVFQAKDSGIFYGFDNSVTTSTGIELFKNQILMLPIGESVGIFFIATGASKNLRFQEGS